MTHRTRHTIPDGHPDRPRVPDVLPRAAAYLRRNWSGGPLHVVLDDGNLGPAHIRYCRAEAVEQEDDDAVWLMDRMLEMTPTQRRRLVARVHEWRARELRGPPE